MNLFGKLFGNKKLNINQNETNFTFLKDTIYNPEIISNADIRLEFQNILSALEVSEKDKIKKIFQLYESLLKEHFLFVKNLNPNYLSDGAHVYELKVYIEFVMVFWVNSILTFNEKKVKKAFGELVYYIIFITFDKFYKNNIEKDYCHDIHTFINDRQNLYLELNRANFNDPRKEIFENLYVYLIKFPGIKISKNINDYFSMSTTSTGKNYIDFSNFDQNQINLLAFSKYYMDLQKRLLNDLNKII